MIESKDFEDLFALLTAHEVRYLIVGGYAVAIHARPRFTEDLDLFVSRKESDVERLCAAFKDFGYGPPEFTADLFRVPDRVVQLGLAPYRIDLLTSVDGIEFEAAWNRRISGVYGAETVTFLCKEDLIASKKAAGRPKDLEDLRILMVSESS